MYTEAYQTYVRLMEELNELIAKNLGDSRAAEKVRNLMRILWPQLSKTEREEFNPNSKLPRIKINGVLCPFFETVVWSVMVIENGKQVYDDLYEITEGDYLAIYGENNEILFDEEIICDFQAGWTAYPDNPFGQGQPSALGYWIHWTQHGWQPDDWAALFFHQYKIGSNGKPLRAELITYARKRK